jgi:hypothetical protein
MSEGRLRRWRPWQDDPHPAVLFGGYGLVVVAVFGLVSLDSASAMVAAVLLLGGVVATLVWWSGMPLPDQPELQNAPDGDEVAPETAPMARDEPRIGS